MKTKFVVLIALAAVKAVAETPEQLERNVERLQVRLTLDREVYLPLEIPRISISITNPTSVPLVVPQPFIPETGTLLLAERLETGRFAVMNEHGFRPPFQATTPTITLAPGESKTLAFRGDQDAFAGKSAEFRLTPDLPNRYRVNYVYTYSGETAVFFRVEHGDSTDHLAEFLVPGPDPDYRQALVVRQGTEYGIFVARRGSRRSMLRDNLVSKKFDGSGNFRSVLRIASSTVPIISLQAELDPLRRIVVRWTDNTNSTRTMMFDLDMNPIP